MREAKGKGPREGSPKGPREDSGSLPKPPRETPAAFQTWRKVACPYCGNPKPAVLKTTDAVHYFQCGSCSLDGEKGTIFPVPHAPVPDAVKDLPNHPKP